MIKAIRARIRRLWLRARQTGTGRVIWRAQADFRRDAGSVYAAAITYYVLLSLFPLLIFLVSVFGLLIQNQELQDRAVDEIVRQLPEGVDLEEQIEGVVADASSVETSVAGLFGLGATIWTASGMFGALRRALNAAFNVPMARPFIHGRILDIASVLAVIVLVTASTVLTAALAIIRGYSNRYFDGPLTNTGWVLVYFLLPLLISFTVFLLIFRLIPNHTLRLRDLWPGALISAIGFEVAKVGFSIYVANFGRYTAIYGTLGGAVAFLFFVFLVANITIFAAEVNAELAKKHAREEAGDRAEAR